MNTESEVSKESLRIRTKLNKLIDDYKTASSTEDDFAKLNNTYLENLKELETEITNKYKTYANKLDYGKDYHETLLNIDNEQQKIQLILKKKMNYEPERLDNDIKQNLKNVMCGFPIFMGVAAIISLVICFITFIISLFSDNTMSKNIMTYSGYGVLICLVLSALGFLGRSYINCDE